MYNIAFTGIINETFRIWGVYKPNNIQLQRDKEVIIKKRIKSDKIISPFLSYHTQQII